MTVCVCSECGAEVTLRSQFELDGPCPQCGEEALVKEDAYDDAPKELVCVDCGYRVDGGAPGHSGGSGDDFYAGRYGVDDPCPRCGGVLDPDPRARRSPRELPEYKVAVAAAAKLRDRGAFEDGVLDVEELARAEGLEVVHGNFPHDGQLVGDTIEVPAVDHVVQRFVIAHELGHRHLRHRVADDRIEPEANAVASHLLVPRDDLRSALRKRPTLDELRHRFVVSREVICYALNDVNGWSWVAPRTPSTR
jgi:predicted RNA-binding Zn-ribbon protein involved in translation (DUF1610 family)